MSSTRHDRDGDPYLRQWGAEPTHQDRHHLGRTMFVLLALTSAACNRGGESAAAVLPDHSWRTVSHGGGPTYTFQAGRRVEMSRQGVTLSGTYEMPTDSTLVATVEGRIPGVGAGGPVRLPLRFDVRLLSPGEGGQQRVEFRAGTVADTLVRVD